MNNSDPGYEYPRHDLHTVRVFPEDYIVEPGTPSSEVERPPPFSYQGVIEFFEHLERELMGAWRAGYEYLTLPFHDDSDFFFNILIQASFIPHNDPERYDDDPFAENYVTLPVQTMGSDVQY